MAGIFIIIQGYNNSSLQVTAAFHTLSSSRYVWRS